MQNKISVIIPTYNSAQSLKKLLASLVKKKDIEIIVVNDGSIDDTDEVIKKYNSIKYIRACKK